MSKKNDDFFVTKKAWSIVKDELLGCYLKPYLAKILLTQKPIVYIDCFAGKGKFEDGNSGSPIIALDIIEESIQSTRARNPIIQPHFIDLHYASDLHNNLSAYKDKVIISGKYEDNIVNILNSKRGYNVFLYIDPYGIKALQCKYFDYFANGQFNTIELLINMNSFGFIREACHALGTNFNDKEIFEDLVEYDSSQMDNSPKSINELNDIAGGEYWQQIIEEFKLGKIDGYKAEELFTKKYCQRLMQSYNYVLNLPLRIKQGQRPKYRLIHITNHRDGCLLMVDNMYSRWEALQDIQTGGQLSFFETDVNENIITDESLREKVIDHFSRYNFEISLNEALANFFVVYGVIASTKEVKSILRELEDMKQIIIKRTPAFTLKNTPTRFMDEKGNHSILIRWNK